MIGCYLYVIAALLLIHPHSTNQCNFGMNKGYVREELLKENKLFGGNKGRNYVCNGLSTEQRQKLCDNAMINLVAHEPFLTATDGIMNRNCKDVRVDKFLDRKSTLPVPSMSGVNDSLVCYSQSIEGLNMSKDMYWCKPRVFTSWLDWNNYDTTSSESDSDESDSDETNSDESDSDSDSSDSDETDSRKTNRMNTNRMNTNQMNTNRMNTNRMNTNWTNTPTKASSMKVSSNNSDQKIHEAEGFFLSGSQNKLEPDVVFIFKPSPRNNGKVIIWAYLTGVRSTWNVATRGRW